jgi:hypothetical protein
VGSVEEQSKFHDPIREYRKSRNASKCENIRECLPFFFATFVLVFSSDSSGMATRVRAVDAAFFIP